MGSMYLFLILKSKSLYQHWLLMSKPWLTKGKLTLKTLSSSSKILGTQSFSSSGRNLKIPQTKILMLQTNYCASATIITIFSNFPFNSFKIGLRKASSDRYFSVMTQLKFFFILSCMLPTVYTDNTTRDRGFSDLQFSSFQYQALGPS